MATVFPGACDCHVHVFDDGAPLVPGAIYRPPHAPVSAYREMQRAVGLQRVVVVQPNGYGFDNSVTLDAVRQLGPGARGIAVVAPDASDEQLAALHAGGIRGVRFMMLPGGALTWADLEPIAERIAPLGWNVNLQLDGRELPQRLTRLQQLPGLLVIDHIAKFLGPVTVHDEAFGALRTLLAGGRTWIKLSAPYESSRAGPPGYADIAPLVTALATEFPERCLWASNWPHPNVQPRPDDAAMLAWAEAAVGNAATWRRMLVDNPAQLYGFG